MNRFGVLKQVGQFILRKKKYWLAPIILVLIFLAIIALMGEGSVVAPLIYSLF